MESNATISYIAIPPLIRWIYMDSLTSVLNTQKIIRTPQDHETMGNFSGVFQANETEFVVDYIYQTHGTFNPTVEGMNAISRSKTRLRLYVVEVDCDYPSIR